VFAVLTLALAAFTAAGCGGDDDSGGGAVARREARLKKLGKGEGQVNLIAWAGYVEDGSTDPNVDWVSDFEKRPAARST
jgi:putative spermidine/putrescine transport system substrate-binding protein